MRKQVLAIGVTMLAIWASSPVWGATDNAEHLIRRAIDMRRTGDDQGAQPLFREAYDLSHSPRAAAQLGFCEQALGRWAEAETHLGESLRAANDAWVIKNRAAIEQALVLIKSRIARIEVSGEPAGADVVVNGSVVGQLPLATPIRAPGGEIEIELRAPGYTPATKKLRVDGGQYQKLFLRAQKEAAAPATAAITRPPADPPVDKQGSPPSTPASPPNLTPPPVAPTPADDISVSESRPSDAGTEGAGSLRKSLKFVSWGLAAASGGMGAYGIARNRSLVGESDSGCGKDAMGVPKVAPNAPPGFTDERCGSLKSQYELAAKLGVIGIVGALVFAGAGVALWLTEPAGIEAQTAHLQCVPDFSARGEPLLGCALRF